MSEQKAVQKDCAIIIKMDKDPEGHDCLAVGLVFTRPQSDQSEPSEAEQFGQIAHNAIIKLYEQLTAPPPQVAPRAPAKGGQGVHLGDGKFGAPDPSARFQTPTIIKGEEQDMRELHDRRKK